MPVLKDKSKRIHLRQSLYQSLDETGLPIPDTVKKLRAVLAMDQAEFSKFVGISLSALRRIEQGHHNVTLTTLDKILKKLSLKIVIKSQRSD